MSLMECVNSGNGRVFFSSCNGQLFECFKNKPMKKFSYENFFLIRDRKHVLEIVEQQVNVLRSMFKGELWFNKLNLSNYRETLEFYHNYRLLSDREYFTYINKCTNIKK